MASFKRDGDVWRVQVFVKGQRDSGSFTTKADAKAWAAQRETELRKQSQTGIASDKSVEDLLMQYRIKVSPTKPGARWEKLRLVAIARTDLAKVKLGDLSSADIVKYRDERLTQVKSSTVNRELNLLSHCFTIARDEWKWIAESPTRKVRRPKDPAPRKRRVLPDELDRVCLACGFSNKVERKEQMVAVAFLFAIETAMRAGEICSLIAGDGKGIKSASYVKGRVAHLGKTKNGDSRDVALCTRALELLAMLPRVEKGQRLFQLTSTQLDGLWRKCRDRAGVEDLHFHDSRHEAITRLSKKMSVLALARMTGHKDVNELQTYYNESADDIAAQLG